MDLPLTLALSPLARGEGINKYSLNGWLVNVKLPAPFIRIHLPYCLPTNGVWYNATHFNQEAVGYEHLNCI